ncbi:hypothetical protein [Motilimonas eburnea]|uniref:hypothetical protein n=1 Tax=Motilimonas eburnea TaxID=1737488 RepID=UPI001E590FEB|nr:hypothetical protein [Motilimonas eburnea]MCE2572585.1 hypothetical protein [Motilimonas eburnea]
MRGKGFKIHVILAQNEYKITIVLGGQIKPNNCLKNVRDLALDHELWTLPPELIQTAGRVNYPGQAFLYTTFSTDNAGSLLQLLEELAIQPGETIVAIYYKLKRGMKLTIPISSALFPDIKRPSDLPSKRDWYSDFLISEFLINPEQGRQHRYLSTAAIANDVLFLHQNIPNNNYTDKNVIAYPSCAVERAIPGASGRFMNLAIGAELARERLYVSHVRRFVIEDYTGLNPGEVSLHFNHQSLGKLSREGDILWTHNPDFKDNA